MTADTIDQLEARMGFDIYMTAYERLAEAPSACAVLARECIKADGLGPVKMALSSCRVSDVEAAHSLMMHLNEDLCEWFP